MDNKELDGILDLVREHKKPSDTAPKKKPLSRAERNAQPIMPVEELDLEPPKKQKEEPKLEPPKKREEIKEIEPPKKKEQKLEPPKKRKEEVKKVEAKEKPKKEEKQKAPKKEKQPKPKKEKAPKVKKEKVKRERKPINKKHLAIAVGALAIIGIIIAIVISSQGAYLKKYESKYGIEFPKGILEEMCDDYGSNQSILAKIEFDDASALVTADKQPTHVYLNKGSKIGDYQFTSIDVSGILDIESRFSSPSKYVSSSQKLTFTTLYDKNDYRVVSAFYVNTNPTDDNNYAFPYSCFGNLTDESFRQFIDKVYSRQLYDVGYIYNYDDKILTLSADTDFMPQFKFVIVAVKCDDFDLVQTVTENKDVHYPQVYYDKTGAKNKYIFASKWYPEIISGDKTKQLTSEDF